MITLRKLSDTQEPLPKNINIAQEGKATRILGVWIGNGIEKQSIWSPNMDNIENVLQH